jgi:hypothetical protein
MFTLEQAHERKDEYSETTSELSRSLSFAGIAVVWVFRVGGDDAAKIPFTADLLLPLAGFALTLLLDFFQNAYGAVSWWVFYRYKESKGVKSDDQVTTPRWMLYPNYACFFGKIGVLVASYVLLIRHIVCAL